MKLDAKVSLGNPVTFRCHWGVFTACGLTNPLPFLSTFFRTALALPRVNRLVSLSSSFLHPLCPFLHPSADQGTFYSAGWVLPPDFESTGASLFTLVINTNCSIQTFEMCLTFLWHVIPSPPFPFPLCYFLTFSVSLFRYLSSRLYNTT